MNGFEIFQLVFICAFFLLFLPFAYQLLNERFDSGSSGEVFYHLRRCAVALSFLHFVLHLCLFIESYHERSNALHITYQSFWDLAILVCFHVLFTLTRCTMEQAFIAASFSRPTWCMLRIRPTFRALFVFMCATLVPCWVTRILYNTLYYDALIVAVYMINTIVVVILLWHYVKELSSFVRHLREQLESHMTDIATTGEATATTTTNGSSHERTCVSPPSTFATALSASTALALDGGTSIATSSAFTLTVVSSSSSSTHTLDGFVRYVGLLTLTALVIVGLQAQTIANTIAAGRCCKPFFSGPFDFEVGVVTLCEFLAFEFYHHFCCSIFRLFWLSGF